MSAEQLVAFSVFAVVTSVTPGPNNLMLTATGANVGIRRGLPHLFGVNLGFAVMVFVVAAGAGSALLASPVFLGAIRYVGIAVLLWLAWRIATAGRAAAADQPPIRFWQAAAFQWVNPKAWLMCAAVVSGFLTADGSGALAQAALFAGIFCVLGMPCSMAWLGFGAAMQRVLQGDRALRAFNVAMGALLAASVVLLL